MKLRNEDGNLMVQNIPNRKTLLIEVAKLLPRHPNRQPKPNEKDAKVAAPAKSGKVTGNKKGGKKGRK